MSCDGVHARCQILGAGALGGLLLMSLKSGLLGLLCKQGSSSGDGGGPHPPRVKGALLCASKSVQNQADIRKVCSGRGHGNFVDRQKGSREVSAISYYYI